MVCYIRKYVIILGDIPIDVPPTKILGDVSPASPAGLTPVVNVMLDADAVINNSSQKVGGSGPIKTHRIYAPVDGDIIKCECGCVAGDHEGGGHERRWQD